MSSKIGFFRLPFSPDQKSNETTESSENSVFDYLIEIMKKEEIPAPYEKTTDLYKCLVRNIRRKLRSMDITLDYLDTEVYARKMARWCERLASKASLMTLGKVQAEKVIPYNTDNTPVLTQEDKKSDIGDRILIEKLPKYANKASSFQRKGKELSLHGEGGSTFHVQNVISGDKEKTLVKKEALDGDVDTWIVELADEEQVRSIQSLNTFQEMNNLTNKTRNPSSVDDWKALTHLREEEEVRWKKRLNKLEERIKKIDKQREIYILGQRPDKSFRVSLRNPGTHQETKSSNTTISNNLKNSFSGQTLRKSILKSNKDVSSDKISKRPPQAFQKVLSSRNGDNKLLQFGTLKRHESAPPKSRLFPK